MLFHSDLSLNYSHCLAGCSSCCIHCGGHGHPISNGMRVRKWTKQCIHNIISFDSQSYYYYDCDVYTIRDELVKWRLSFRQRERKSKSTAKFQRMKRKRQKRATRWMWRMIYCEIRFCVGLKCFAFEINITVCSVWFSRRGPHKHKFYRAAAHVNSDFNTFMRIFVDSGEFLWFQMYENSTN